jgi:hypothetical protein
MVEDLSKMRNAKEGGEEPGVYDKSYYFFPIPANETIFIDSRK